MKSSDPIYFLMRVGIIVVSVVILVYLFNTEVIKNSKSKVKDSIKFDFNKINLQDIDLSLEGFYDAVLLIFYDLFIQCNITAVLTIIIFFGGMLIRYLTKTKITVKFILKLLILGLLISFITIANGINYLLNIEIGANNNFNTLEEFLIELSESSDKSKKLLQMLHVARTTSYISFGLMTIILITQIYK